MKNANWKDQLTAVNVVMTNYTLHGKNIVHMTQGSNSMHFFYDACNKPAIVDFNGTKYAYVHNLQGDIVAILDSDGITVILYTYDTWDKPISKAIPSAIAATSLPKRQGCIISEAGIISHSGVGLSMRMHCFPTIVISMHIALIPPLTLQIPMENCFRNCLICYLH